MPLIIHNYFSFCGLYTPDLTKYHSRVMSYQFGLFLYKKYVHVFMLHKKALTEKYKLSISHKLG